MSTENNDAPREDQEPINSPDMIIETPMDHERAKPKTHFEMMLQAAMNKPELAGSLMGAFMSAEVFFLSREEVTGENKNAQPLLLTNPAGAPMVAVFTSLERIPTSYIDQAGYGVKVQGASIVRALEGTGFVVNPGDELSFEIPADGVAILKEQLLNQKPGSED
ncbi:SseB family protein [Glutamicibacter sp.]|uniref:SseB family protein n=1 Tax=Glutamicibacter sp. TaxID=1931995 RepID=UPI0028BE962B|nr:SseB family protein [Glutamicibacter sp.]